MKKLPFLWMAAGGVMVALNLLAPTAAFSGKKKSGAAPSEGKSLFDRNCKMCHHADKAGAKVGPGLKDLFKNQELPSTHRPATEANVRQQIEQGNPHAKPMAMPAFANKLSDQEMQALLDYLKTL